MALKTNLTLRSIISPFLTPFNDATPGYVLSHNDLDNNFLYLKGNIIHNAKFSGSTLLLEKINGDTIDIGLPETLLYDSLGDNIDGPINQKIVSDNLELKVDKIEEHELVSIAHLIHRVNMSVRQDNMNMKLILK